MLILGSSTEALAVISSLSLDSGGRGNSFAGILMPLAVPFFSAKIFSAIPSFAAVFTAAAFSATALAVHVALAVGASLLLTRCSLDEALVASNAAIGGPGTAAAFAAAIGRPELVLSAAVWGTVGYAGGTTLGVAVWRVLRP